MTERIANFCPLCGAPTALQERYGRLRPVCTACGHTVFFEPKVAVVAFITQDNALLLIQRAGDPGKGLWALAGGYVDVDEDPKDALVREIQEETGLMIHVGKILDVFYSGVITLAYAAEIIGGSIIPGDDAAAVAWFHKDEIPELVFLSTETLVGRWQEEIARNC